jgi:acyl carrier protein
MTQVIDSEKFDVLVNLIKEVKPSLVDAVIKAEDSVGETLGLDSLDMLQLARKIRRALGGNFDLDSWGQRKATHRGSLQSILDDIIGVPALS